MKKRTFLLFVIFLGLFFLLFITKEALAREWGEIDWPDLPGMTSPTSIPEDQLTLGYFITYIFTFALLVVGVVAFLMLIVNAIRYMASPAMPAGKAAATEQMKNIGYGILLILGAYIILNTINPELVIYGIEKGTIKFTPGGAITLYKQANCAGDEVLQILESSDLGEWNDETVSFKITDGSVVRICHDTGYKNCEIFIGDGACLDAAALGFTPGAPDGISSAKVDGGENIDLIVFEDADCEGRYSQGFVNEGLCQRITSFMGGGNSYWLRKDHQAILCEDNWNNCSDKIGPPASPTDCTNRANVETICVYECDPAGCPPVAPLGYCVGMFLTDGGGRDFVPSFSGCKNLGKNLGGTSGNKVDTSQVGEGCKVNVYTEEHCTGDLEILNSGETSSKNVKSASGL